MSTYLLVDLGCLAVPLLASFHPKFPFYKNWRFFFPACLISGVVFVLWDIYFTQLGIWGFNEQHLVGVYLFNLPLEEYLFFFCIPYACVFSYYGFTQLGKEVSLRSGLVLSVLSWLLFILGIVYLDHLYTSVTFLALFLFLRWLLYQKSPYLDLFLVTYVFILLPFLIANGILTGSWIQDEVVWYNDAHNLGIRLGTIPIEDSMYGMLLIFLNIYLYEWFRSKAVQADQQEQRPA